jgi:DNA repair photolyase
MFPTTHDITPTTLDLSRQVLRELTSRGNRVLIVSKPHLECVEALCADLRDVRPLVQFRFTIGTNDAAVARFWEPGAPAPAERIEALLSAFLSGFQTGVSMEPLLCDADRAVAFVGDNLQRWVFHFNKSTA